MFDLNYYNELKLVIDHYEKMMKQTDIYGHGKVGYVNNRHLRDKIKDDISIRHDIELFLTIHTDYMHWYMKTDNKNVLMKIKKMYYDEV